MTDITFRFGGWQVCWRMITPEWYPWWLEGGAEAPNGQHILRTREQARQLAREIKARDRHGMMTVRVFKVSALCFGELQ